MNIYEVVFAQNNIIACNIERGDVTFKGPYSYEYSNGQLRYALVKAASESRARAVSEMVVKEVNEKFSE